jgi:hypothetical protein
MKTPFTSEQFFSVFVNYNTSVFPLQIVIIVTGILGLLAVHTGLKWKNRFIAGVLASLWLWTGIVYHVSFFAAINKAANVFGGLFVLQGLYLLWEGVVRDRLKFDFTRDSRGYLGYFFILYGLLIYPVAGYLFEPQAERIISLGLPCPTTITTFGFFILAAPKFPKYLLIIPTLWAIIGISAVINLGVYQDLMMQIAAIATISIFFTAKKITD